MTRTPATVTADEAAAILGKSRSWFFALVKAGFVPKLARGRYELAAIARGVLDHAEDLAATRTAGAALTGVAEARAREIEQRIAMRDRSLIPLADAEMAMTKLCGVVNAELSGLPARATRNLPARRLIEAEVHDTRVRISEALAGMSGAAASGDFPN